MLLSSEVTSCILMRWPFSFGSQTEALSSALCTVYQSDLPNNNTRVYIIAVTYQATLQSGKLSKNRHMKENK